MTSDMNRRAFLAKSTLLGCSAAASPLLTPMSFASAPWDNRLVVIILRGALDGLDAVRPWGDRSFSGLRPHLAADRPESLMLNDYFGLHPSLAPLMPLWSAGELGFVQATSTPYRNKRSHFDGQDLLEAGTAKLGPAGERDGWLNRMLDGIPDVSTETAYAIGQEEMLLVKGTAPVANWSPDVDLSLSSQGLRLLQLTMQDDPRLAAIMNEAILLAGKDGDAVVSDLSMDDMMAATNADMKKVSGASNSYLKIAEFAGQRLREETRVASFSLGGWDTHNAQDRALRGPMTRLAKTLLTLKNTTGPDVWGKTTVLAMTEFGRTVRENGTRGTDHGTGGAMILSGGALRGGQVLGRWPGLSEADLFDRRDLMPTSDVRAWAAWAMRSSFGLSRAHLERTVFPGLDMGNDPDLLL